jgi:tetratricopeptide (TPR) repeat protein
MRGQELCCDVHAAIVSSVIIMSNNILMKIVETTGALPLGVVVVALLLVAQAAMSFEQQDAAKRDRNVERAFEYLGLGRESLLRGDYLRAVRILSVSINGNPTPEAFKLRGQAYDLLGSYTVSDLSQYISADPSNSSGYLLRADAHTFHGRHEKAIEDYSNSIRLDASSTDAYLGRGIAYAAIERYGEAIRDFKKALSQQPENLDALYDTAVVYMLAKRPVESPGFLQRQLSWNQIQNSNKNRKPDCQNPKKSRQTKRRRAALNS